MGKGAREIQCKPLRRISQEEGRNRNEKVGDPRIAPADQQLARNLHIDTTLVLLFVNPLFRIMHFLPASSESYPSLPNVSSPPEIREGMGNSSVNCVPRPSALCTLINAP